MKNKIKNLVVGLLSLCLLTVAPSIVQGATKTVNIKNIPISSMKQQKIKKDVKYTVNYNINNDDYVGMLYKPTKDGKITITCSNLVTDYKKSRVVMHIGIFKPNSDDFYPLPFNFTNNKSTFCTLWLNSKDFKGKKYYEGTTVKGSLNVSKDYYYVIVLADKYKLDSDGGQTSISKCKFDMQIQEKKSPHLNKTIRLLGKNEEYVLPLVDAPKGKKVTYTTSNKEVATVTEKGVITAKKRGETTITVKCNNKSYKCKIYVLDLPNEITMSSNSTEDLYIDYMIGFRTELGEDIYAELISTNTSVVEIEQNSLGLLRSKEQGTATIKIKLDDVTKKIKIIVKDE